MLAALMDAGRWRARLRGHLLAEGLCGPRYCGGRPPSRSGGTAMRATPRLFLLLNTTVHQTLSYPTRSFPPRLNRGPGAERHAEGEGGCAGGASPPARRAAQRPPDGAAAPKAEVASAFV